MHRQFAIEAPSGVLSKYQAMFNEKDIHFTQCLPVVDPTHVVLEDSNDVYTSEEGWVGSVSSVISHISIEEVLYVTNQEGNKALLWRK